MESTGTHPSRRAVLTLGAGAALSATVLARGKANASTDGISEQFKALEQEYSARLGVFAYDIATNRTVAYRAGELFPMCSVFKALAAGAVLRDLDHDGEFLAKRIRYTEKYVVDTGYAPITSRPENLANGMTVEQLCVAAVSHSDNGAANLLLRELGGPTAITRFARSIDDDTTRLDRWEPELNSAEPWRVTDTTNPRAIGKSFARLVFGDALASADRKRLTTWMVHNTTNDERFGAGLPDDWVVADKTGGGDEYGVANDVGVALKPSGSPIVLSVLSTKYDPNGPAEDPLVARTATLLAEALA